MKYYSEELNRLFENTNDLRKAEMEARKEKEDAEARAEQLKAERKARAEEVDKAYNELQEAKKNYSTLLNKFVEDYGSYHKTYTPSNRLSLFDLFM